MKNYKLQEEIGILNGKQRTETYCYPSSTYNIINSPFIAKLLKKIENGNNL